MTCGSIDYDYIRRALKVLELIFENQTYTGSIYSDVPSTVSVIFGHRLIDH